ncbi:MAG: radical SAM protein [Desulfovibrionaceae bacterium]|nr:radical SAM protein [Desulfovibrionaceae bacterium]
MSSMDVVRHFGSRGKGFSSPDNFLLRTLKGVHLLGACAWVGGSLGLQALCFLLHSGSKGLEADEIKACLIFLDTWVVMPGLMICLLTGLFYSMATALGFFRFFWITFKWIITFSAAFLGFGFFFPLGDNLIAYLKPLGLDSPLRLLKGFLFPEYGWQAAIQLLVLSLMVFISIFRPLSLAEIKTRFKAKLGREKLSETYPLKTSLTWFDPNLIDKALERRRPPEKEELEDILAKARDLEVLNLEETVALMRVTSERDIASLLTCADEVKRKIYGDRIVLTAPLHISNYCGSDCQYCAYRKSNHVVERKHLSLKEVEIAARSLLKQGLTRVFLVTGQFPRGDVNLLTKAVQLLYELKDQDRAFARVSVNVGPLTREEYLILKQAQVGTILIYQDTYHAKSYRLAHPTGPKSDLELRLKAPDVAQSAGVGDAGLGIVLGLGPWQYDLLGLVAHATHLMEVYGTGCRSISMHRLRAAPGCDFQTPYPVSDATYAKCVAIIRLAIPYTSLILTTKEPAGLWSQGCKVGGSHLLTGSVANPYSPWQNGLDQVPFPLGEDCHVDEIVHTLLASKLLPSFCAACPRVGRRGEMFTSLAAVGGLKERCDYHSLISLKTYLDNLAKPETKELGLLALQERLALMPEKLRDKTKQAIEDLKA